jgi:hypothetical protein
MVQQSRTVELPVTAWEQFLLTGDADALLATIQMIPDRPKLRGESYPELHRICDIDLGGNAYRLTRLFDPADQTQRLFITRTDVPDFHADGVPYWLQGVALARWVHEETESPSDSAPDWEEYRHS